MSQYPDPDDHNLALLLLPPHISGEMQAARTEILTWYANGGVPSAAPVDALTKVVRQLLAFGNQSLNELADPATRQAMSRERKQGDLDAFREVLNLHAASGLDAADLIAEAERLKLEAQRDGLEKSEKVAKWTELATMLQEKEDLERRLGVQVVELGAEEGLR